jgi:nucleotide-binding universal stress UspA family protein
MKNIVVGLELNHIDEYLLSYIARATNFLKPTDFTFFTIHHDELPEEIRAKFPELAHEIDEHYVKEMVEETNKLRGIPTNLHFKAIEGNVLKRILELSNEETTDLLVLGRQRFKQDRKIQFKEIVRNAVSDVLIIPEEVVPKHERILIAIDFSEYSRDAILKALEIAKHAKAKLYIEHVYKVPMGYSKTGKSFTEFASIMKRNAEQSMTTFLGDIDLSSVDYEFLYALDKEHSAADVILETVKKINPQLIVLGSKGKNLFSALLVGSTAESFLDEPGLKTPLLLTRIRNKSVGFWDAIKEF